MEAVDILLAGSDTTAFTLATSLFHILNTEGVKTKLVEALKEAIPSLDGIPSLAKLEKIDYLVGSVLC